MRSQRVAVRSQHVGVRSRRARTRTRVRWRPTRPLGRSLPLGRSIRPPGPSRAEYGKTCGVGCIALHIRRLHIRDRPVRSRRVGWNAFLSPLRRNLYSARSRELLDARRRRARVAWRSSVPSSKCTRTAWRPCSSTRARRSATRSRRAAGRRRLWCRKVGAGPSHTLKTACVESVLYGALQNAHYTS